jgi:hypothetical protein
MKANWSKPYYGITHLGKYSTTKHWVTVTFGDNWATLDKWFPGCGFNSDTEEFSSLEEAKKAGENYMKKMENLASEWKIT